MAPHPSLLPHLLRSLRRAAARASAIALLTVLWCCLCFLCVLLSVLRYCAICYGLCIPPARIALLASLCWLPRYFTSLSAAFRAIALLAMLLILCVCVVCVLSVAACCYRATVTFHCVRTAAIHSATGALLLVRVC